jgi:hypothetical protein
MSWYVLQCEDYGNALLAVVIHVVSWSFLNSACYVYDATLRFPK